MMIRTKEERYLTVNHIPANLKEDFMSSTDIYSTIGNNKSLPNILDNIEKNIIINELDNNDWNITQTSKSLGVDRQVLYYKMKRLGIERKSSV